MPSLVEILGAQGVQQPNIAQNVSQGVQAGVQLATAAETVEQKKLQTQEMQEQLETGKFNKAVTNMQLLARTNPAIAKRMVPKIAEQLRAADIGIDQSVLESLASDDGFKTRFQSIGDGLSGLANNAESRQGFLTAMSDIGMFDKGLTIFGDQKKADLAAAVEARKAKTDQAKLDLENRKVGVTEAKAEAAANKAGAKLTKGEEAVDRKFAADFVDWEALGGAASVNKQLDTLAGPLKRLEEGKGSGGILDALPKGAKDFINPKNAAIQDEISEVVQGSLKATLGAAFTAKEGEGIMARAFNPNQTPAENLKRVGRLVTSIRAAAEAKEAASDYFRENGTLQGYKGKTRLNIDGATVDVGAQVTGSAPAATTPTAAPKVTTQQLSAAQALVGKVVNPKTGQPYTQAEVDARLAGR